MNPLLGSTLAILAGHLRRVGARAADAIVYDRSLAGFPTDVVLFGSTVMALHGLRDDVGDVDLFTQPGLATRLARAGWTWQAPRDGDPWFLELALAAPLKTCHAFDAWTARDPWIDVGQALRHAEVVNGWPCIPLWMVAMHKRQALAIIRSWGVTVAGSPWEKHERPGPARSAPGVMSGPVAGEVSEHAWRAWLTMPTRDWITPRKLYQEGVQHRGPTGRPARYLFRSMDVAAAALAELWRAGHVEQRSSGGGFEYRRRGP